MIGRRRLGLVYLLGSLLLLVASLHPSTAYSAPGDPPSGSPASAVYELPLQQGRADAAPKDVDGGGGGGGARAGGKASGEGGEATSLYRSENNFGSSSHVPGLAAAGRAGGGARGGGAGPGGAAGTGAGGGPGGGAGAAIASGAIAGQVTDAGNTSVPAGLALLGAIALLAGGVAVLSRRYL